VHLSTAEGLSRIAEMQNEGVKVYAETCPQYLLLDESLYNEPDFGGAKYVMSPPLRKEKDRVALWNGLRKGTIQLVGSDHCPFNMKDQKIMGKDDFTKIPNGAPGVETSLPLLYSEGVAKGRISINRLVEVFSTNPAKLYGLYPKKGCIAVGSDADIVIFDPEKEVTLSVDILHQNVDYTPYEGWKVKGYPITTIVRGKIVCNDGEFFGEKGYGKYLPRGVAMDLWQFYLLLRTRCLI
jgi:dihydropyrimidinase